MKDTQVLEAQRQRIKGQAGLIRLQPKKSPQQQNRDGERVASESGGRNGSIVSRLSKVCNGRRLSARELISLCSDCLILPFPSKKASCCWLACK